MGKRATEELAEKASIDLIPVVLCCRAPLLNLVSWVFGFRCKFCDTSTFHLRFMGALSQLSSTTVSYMCCDPSLNTGNKDPKTWDDLYVERFTPVPIQY
jgi:hypothetical protein